MTIIEDDLRLDPLKLLHFIEQSSINRIFLPFVALQQLAEVAEAHTIFPASLQEVMTAGEQLKITTQILHFFSRLPGCTLYNQYGPTEAHVVTSLKLGDNPTYWPSLPTIGTPIHNTRIFILDAELNAVADGEVGELCIEGASLADGYLNDPFTESVSLN